MTEIQPGEFLGRRVLLRIDQLELAAARLHEWRASLGTHADPIEGPRRGTSAVGFDSDVESALVERIDQRVVELEERLTTGAHDVFRATTRTI